jgi:hypothetical protein
MYLLFSLREIFSQAKTACSKSNIPPAVIKMVTWAPVKRGLVVYIMGVL